MPISLPFCQVSITVLEFIIKTYPWTDFHQASFHRAPRLDGVRCASGAQVPHLPGCDCSSSSPPPHQAGGSTLLWNHLEASACSAPCPPQAVVPSVYSAAWALGSGRFEPSLVNLIFRQGGERPRGQRFCSSFCGVLGAWQHLTEARCSTNVCPTRG